MITDAGVDPQARGERLAIDDFARIAQALGRTERGDPVGSEGNPGAEPGTVET